MFNSLKKISTELLRLVNLLLFSLFFYSCAIKTNHEDLDLFNKGRITTERQLLFEKANALVVATEYSKAQYLFTNLVGSAGEKKDSVYFLSLWSLVYIHEKLDQPEKAILILNQIAEEKLEVEDNLNLQVHFMKNYFLVSNSKQAFLAKKKIDQISTSYIIPSQKLFIILTKAIDFNYDMNIISEIKFLNEFQKYVLFALEQNDPETNQKTIDLLMDVYQNIFELLQKKSLSESRKHEIAVALLDSLRQFDRLRTNETEIYDLKKFLEFSEVKQKKITEWLHQ